MDRVVTTFPTLAESEKARRRLDALGLPYEKLSPFPAYRHVATPAIVLEEAAKSALYQAEADPFTCSGWVEYHPGDQPVPQEEPPAYEEDLFGRAAVMVFAPCVADMTKIRFIAHLSGDLSGVMPYLNAVMREASFNPSAPTLTYLERYRFIVLYPRRVVVARADDLVDGWRVLESIRRRANETWSRRAEIEPSYERREKPPALEIYKRLPKTNCRACGQKTCLAFAVGVYMGHVAVTRCAPVFEGLHSHLKDALVEICAGLGVADGESDATTRAANPAEE